MEIKVRYLMAALLIPLSITLKPGYISPNSPSTYRGETGNLTCPLLPSHLENLTEFGYTITAIDTLSDIGHAICDVQHIDGVVHVVSIDVRLPNDCNDTYYTVLNMNNYALITFPVMLNFRANLSCFISTSEEFIETETFASITELLVAPTSLVIKTMPENVFSGDRVSIACRSVGGDPPASFKYAVNGNEVNESAFEFVATRSDHGQVYSCQDLSHPNYNGGRDDVTYQELKFNVFYLIGQQKYVLLKPATDSVRLRCLVSYKIPSDVKLIHTWEKDGEIVATGTEVEVQRPQNWKPKSSEIYKCHAQLTNKRFKSITVEFKVAWRGEFEPDYSLNLGWILLIGFTIIILMSALSVCLIIYWTQKRKLKKRKIANADLFKEISSVVVANEMENFVAATNDISLITSTHKIKDSAIAIVEKRSSKFTKVSAMRNPSSADVQNKIGSGVDIKSDNAEAEAVLDIDIVDEKKTMKAKIDKITKIQITKHTKPNLDFASSAKKPSSPKSTEQRKFMMIQAVEKRKNNLLKAAQLKKFNLEGRKLNDPRQPGG